MAKSFFIETFGCQMNQHDSEKIAGLLARQGMVAVPSLEKADWFILNTCSVREKAVQKVYSRLGEVKKRKKEHPEFKIGVVGCVAQQEGEELVKKAPFVDLVVGTHLYHSIPDLLEELDKNPFPHRHKVATNFLPGPTPIEITSVIRGNDFRANITIMEGCNKLCSFCIVPYTRGKERNRPTEMIIDEVRKAAEKGYSEILLLGQTVNSYRDPENRKFKFAHLLEKITEIPGIQRIRFTSPHPREFDAPTIHTMDNFDKICNQVHLPVQSGANKILKRMRRRYTRESYLDLVGKFRNCHRSFALSTDIIVGFPGETEADFEKTLSLLKKAKFESVFSFKYSPRPYTPAASWTDDVPGEEKTKRLMILQRTQNEIQLKIHQERYLGQIFEVLVEGIARDGQKLYGRTTTNKIINFSGNSTPGTFEKLLVTGVNIHSLLGQLTQKNNKTSILAQQSLKLGKQPLTEKDS